MDDNTISPVANVLRKHDEEALIYSFAGEANAEWAIVDRTITYLPPSTFTELPMNVVRFLQDGGYSIPQAYHIRKPHNVIRGEFRKKGCKDLAALCSRKGFSSIIIFWSGSVKDFSEISKSSDKAWLQGRGDGKEAYSRAISVVGKDYIVEHYRRYGGPKPPPIDHQGIDEAFVCKASWVHYLYNGKWLRLTGAD